VQPPAVHREMLEGPLDHPALVELARARLPTIAGHEALQREAAADLASLTIVGMGHHHPAVEKARVIASTFLQEIVIPHTARDALNGKHGPLLQNFDLSSFRPPLHFSHTET